jgi:hypothetical protein
MVIVTALLHEVLASAGSSCAVIITTTFTTTHPTTITLDFAEDPGLLLLLLPTDCYHRFSVDVHIDASVKVVRCHPSSRLNSTFSSAALSLIRMEWWFPSTKALPAAPLCPRNAVNAANCFRYFLAPLK